MLKLLFDGWAAGKHLLIQLQVCLAQAFAGTEDKGDCDAQCGHFQV